VLMEAAGVRAAGVRWAAATGWMAAVSIQVATFSSCCITN
jgi:hypothetical protein